MRATWCLLISFSPTINTMAPAFGSFLGPLGVRGNGLKMNFLDDIQPDGYASRSGSVAAIGGIVATLAATAFLAKTTDNSARHTSCTALSRLIALLHQASACHIRRCVGSTNQLVFCCDRIHRLLCVFFGVRLACFVRSSRGDWCCESFSACARVWMYLNSRRSGRPDRTAYYSTQQER